MVKYREGLQNKKVAVSKLGRRHPASVNITSALMSADTKGSPEPALAFYE